MKTVTEKIFDRALEYLNKNEAAEIWLPCIDKNQANSLRVMLYRERARYRDTVDSNIEAKLGISKTIDNEQHYVVLLIRGADALIKGFVKEKNSIAEFSIEGEKDESSNSKSRPDSTG